MLRTAASMILLSLLAAAPPATTSPSEAQRIFEQAKKLDTGEEKNDAPAAALYLKSAEMGYAPAMVEIGSCYGTGMGVPEDAEQARKWYARAAELGDAAGMWRLGMVHRLKNEHALAVQWIEKAANLGNADAQFNLGDMYIHGDGVARDPDRGLKLVIQSVATRPESARMTYIGGVYARAEFERHDFGEARKWFTKAAELNDDQAMLMLGLMHEQGRGVEQSEAKALEWYRKGEKLNSASCIVAIGLAHVGKGDSAGAIPYLRRAAELRDRQAMFMLGVAYREGDGVERDIKQARKHFTESARLGYAPAKEALGKLPQRRFRE